MEGVEEEVEACSRMGLTARPSALGALNGLAVARCCFAASILRGAGWPRVTQEAKSLARKRRSRRDRCGAVPARRGLERMAIAGGSCV